MRPQDFDLVQLIKMIDGLKVEKAQEIHSMENQACYIRLGTKVDFFCSAACHFARLCLTCCFSCSLVLDGKVPDTAV